MYSGLLAQELVVWQQTHILVYMYIDVQWVSEINVALFQV